MIDDAQQVLLEETFEIKGISEACSRRLVSVHRSAVRVPESRAGSDDVPGRETGPGPQMSNTPLLAVGTVFTV